MIRLETSPPVRHRKVAGVPSRTCQKLDVGLSSAPLPTQLHGLAALQWSICQDSLRRSDEARSMYEKLQSHPNPGVSKKARQFVFSFQAVEMMKVTGSTFSSTNTGYQNYFNAFIRDKVNYSQNEDETEQGAIQQAIPYIIFLLFPIFIVLLIAVRKGI
ncbi:putative intron-binding protein aquarius-like [Capsicum annuum]|nr:putative intron-binding protein aquarius-like [Capsicum annuum]KAF3659405.1 putative intron-binding protein aquarius-like [Capsicum annuum]